MEEPLEFHPETERVLENIETRAQMEDSIKGDGWQNFFEGFLEKVWPEFQKRGFSLDTALLAWQNNSIINELSDLVVAFEYFAATHAQADDEDEEE